jgi:hypothetical protein
MTSQLWSDIKNTKLPDTQKTNERIVLKLLYKITQKYSYNRIFESYNNKNIIDKLVIIFKKSPQTYLMDVDMELDKQFKTSKVLSNYKNNIFKNYVGIRISKKDAKLQEIEETDEVTTAAPTPVGYVDIVLLLLGIIYNRVSVENKYKLAELLYNYDNNYLQKAIDVENKKLSVDNVLFGIEGFNNENDSIIWIYIMLAIFLIIVITIYYKSKANQSYLSKYYNPMLL